MAKMKLTYYRGNNFGDSLNPIIFQNFVPEILSENSEYKLLGIGSIIGKIAPNPSTQKTIVFSSGFAGGAYGKLPPKKELTQYDFRCVRGPLTAKTLGLAADKSICDAAILLPEVLPTPREKKYKFSYMSHHRSLEMYAYWSKLFESIGINFIDPKSDVDFIIEEIKQTEVFLAEAMHAAIVADAYRIPWIPVKSYPFINRFKWNDYCSSIGVNYEPVKVKSLIDQGRLERELQKRSPMKLDRTIRTFVKTVNSYQSTFREKEVISQLNKLKNAKVYLSSESVLNSKKERLIHELYKMKNEYAGLS